MFQNVATETGTGDGIGIGMDDEDLDLDLDFDVIPVDNDNDNGNDNGYDNGNDNGNPNDDNNDTTTTATTATELPPRANLKEMGWRICTNPIWKVVNDRYGRKGTRARFLARFGTNHDVLAYKPDDSDEKPRVPRGFATDRILGKFSGTRRDPYLKNKQNGGTHQYGGGGGTNQYGSGGGGQYGSGGGGQYGGGGGGKRRRNNDDNRGRTDAYGNPVSMDSALGGGRGDDKEGGFSVEDLMREREEKRKNQTL